MAQKTVRRSRRTREVSLGFQWGRLNYALLGAGILVLLIGYLALVQGSITLAPILLVLGYCGLIPASLLIRSNKATSGE